MTPLFVPCLVCARPGWVHLHAVGGVVRHPASPDCLLPPRDVRHPEGRGWAVRALNATETGERGRARVPGGGEAYPERRAS